MLKKLTTSLLLCSGLLLKDAAVFALDDTEKMMEPESLESRIQEVIQEYNLTEENIAVSYQNTVTNETYAYNDTTYLFAASTYKLPLNIYYYIMINDGQISPSDYVDGYVLSEAQKLSILLSDNDSSMALIHALAGYTDYKYLMLQTFGDSYFSVITNADPLTYLDNYYPSGFLLNVLQYLYAHMGDFEEMLSYMCSDEQNNAVYNTVRDEVTVYQKQGWTSSDNAVAEIVMCDEPYLAAIIVNDPSYRSPEILSTVNEVIYQYHLEMEDYNKTVNTYAEEMSEKEIVTDIDHSKVNADDFAKYAENTNIFISIVSIIFIIPITLSLIMTFIRN